MKTRRVCAIFAVISVACSVRGAEKEAPAALEVHEWGTFTTLSGSDGAAVGWYLHQLAEVPSFVGSTTARLPDGIEVAGKTGTAQHNWPKTAGVQKGTGVSGTIEAPAPRLNRLTKVGTGTLTLGFIPARIRMETPVLYFYPQKAMLVHVDVHFDEGTLTEYYPPPKTAHWAEQTVWEGELRPPTDPEAARLIPSVKGEAGDNYGEARQVPDAWYFHATQPSVKPERSWEKFIFYRGSGTKVPPLVAKATGPHTVQLAVDSRGPSTQPASWEVRADSGHSHWGLSTWAFALQVEGDRARWKALPPLEQSASAAKADGVSVELTQDEPLDQADAELSAAVTEKLMNSGLTVQEARAMVATWHKFWFREPGTRIVGLVPRTWVDQVLPLHIEPAPQVIQRVFVGRWELITPDQEKVIADMLASQDPMISGSDMDHIHALHLGRFTQGAWARVLELTKGRKPTEISEIRRKILQDALEAEAQPQPAKAVSQR